MTDVASLHQNSQELAEGAASDKITSLGVEVPRRRTFGDTLYILKDLLAFQKAKHQRYGKAYQTSFLFQPGLSFADPEVAREVLCDRKDNFSSSMGWERSLGTFFQNGLLDRDFADHRYHRKLLQQVFRGPALQRYLELMASSISEDLEKWPSDQPFRVYPLVKGLTLKIASKAFLGLSIQQESKQLIRAFSDLIAGSTAFVRVPVLGQTYMRAFKAREYLEKFLRGKIEQRRHQEGEDLFSQLCVAKNEEGEHFTDQEVVDHLIFLLLAAHDTVTSAITHSLFYLAKYPEWQDRLRKQEATLSWESLSMDEMEKWTEADHVLYEVLRLHPPVPAIPRKALSTCQIAGYRIPENQIVWINVLYQHRMPEFWTQGDEFDPDRFSAPRAEHKQHPFLWIPYGGGAHVCLGKLFSRLQVKLFLRNCLGRWQVKLTREDYSLKLKHVPIVKPFDELPIIFNSLSKNAKK